ncbi:MAG: YicC/YloC family endoribonuclease, partial [Comamonas sp.]
MAVYSMTGYASAQHGSSAEAGEASSRNVRLGLEIRSVNSRFLDLTFRLPDELRAQEPALRTLLTARLKRGKVEVRAAIDLDAASSLPQPSPALLQRLVSLQDQVQAWLPDAKGLSVADAMRLCGQGQSSAVDWSEIAPALAEQAVGELISAREREGKRLAQMLLDRTKQLRALAEQAGPLVPQLVEQQRQRFLERWQEAMGLTEGQATPEAAQDRALSEATAFAIRIDVAEEITRLGSHLDEVDRLIKKGGEIGKRLDFLIQEMHREANTLGSKSAALELTRISVDMKVLIEQMR